MLFSLMQMCIKQEEMFYQWCNFSLLSLFFLERNCFYCTNQRVYEQIVHVLPSKNNLLVKLTQASDLIKHVYMYTCTHMHAYTKTCMHRCMHAQKHVCTHIPIKKIMYTCTHACTYACARIHTHRQMCIPYGFMFSCICCCTSGKA